MSTSRPTRIWLRRRSLSGSITSPLRSVYRHFRETIVERQGMGAHKSTNRIENVKRSIVKFFTPLSRKFMPPAEARSHQQALREMYRSRFGLEMHPLQNERSMVPPARVINAVQGKSKSDPDTFL